MQIKDAVEKLRRDQSNVNKKSCKERGQIILKQSQGIENNQITNT